MSELSNKEHYILYLKYKTKYLNLKSQIKTNFEPEIEFLTSKINPSLTYYYNQNLFSYWISSSHNTYLPYGQIFDPASVCYYRLQSAMYCGGCFEIDTDGITPDKKDVIVTHLPTNIKSIKLSSILKIICEAMENKKRKNILSGPLILTFDNKKLKKKEQHLVFWNVIEQELINKSPNLILKIDNSFNLSNIPISELNNKILLRWGENKNCNDSTSLDSAIGKDVCPPPKSILKKISLNPFLWMHLQKGHIKLGKNIVSDRNKTISISVPLNNKISDPNQNLISNTQRNLMRIYPHWSSVQSGNYQNMKFFRDGIQIVALNLQTIGEPWYLNKAVFLPGTGVPCTPIQTFNSNENKCFKGWNNSINDEQPLTYRLKPLWLLGLIPHPGYYNLDIELIKVERINDNKDNKENFSTEYTNIEFMYGLNYQKKSANKFNNVFRLDNIDVSIPFFVVKLWKKNLTIKSEYKSGVEIPWSISKLSDTIQIDLYKIKKTKFGSYNKVDLDKLNPDNDCLNSYIFNTNKQVRITIKYVWSKSKIEYLTKYNNAIKQLRTNGEFSGKKTIDFLNNLTLFNQYQDKLSQLLASNSKIETDDNGLDMISEGQEDESYENEMIKYKNNDKETKQNDVVDE